MATAPTNQGRRVLNVSVPPEMYDAIEAIAAEENRTKSELIREAIRHYQFLRRWRLIRQWGKTSAIELDIESDEALEQFLG